MKALKTLIAIALSAGGLGTAVTLGAIANKNNQKIEKVEAATSTTVYYAISSTDVGSYSVKCNTNHKGDGDDWHQYTMNDAGFTYNSKKVYSVTFTDTYNGLGALQFQLYNGNTWVSQVQPISSWTTPSTYNTKIWEKGGDAWKDFYYLTVNSGAKQQMTKNGNTSEYTKTLTLASNDTLAFYKNNVSYSVTGETNANNNITSDLKIRSAGSIGIYLKTNTNQVWASGYIPDEGYIYYVSAESYTTPNYIYSWGGTEQFGTWGGTAITSVSGYKELSTVVNFNGKQGYIYKIPVNSSDSNFKLHNNSGTESVNKTLTLGGTYWWDSTTADMDATIALDLIDRIETARIAASYTKGNASFSYSVCGISQSTAASLCNEYNAITSSAAKSYFDKSTTYTWIDATSNDNSNQQNWTFKQIIDQLAAISSGNGSGTNSKYFQSLTITESFVPIAVVVTSLISSAALGTFFLLRKKRKEQ